METHRGGYKVWVTHRSQYGYDGSVKTTLDIHDELLLRAKRHAQRTGRPLRAVVEEGLRQVLAEPSPGPRYRLPDLSFGNAGDEDPLESHSWQDLRDIIYGDSETR